MLSGTRMSIQRVPVAGPGLAEKPNTGGFTLVGVLVPLSVQTSPRLQKPCSVGGLTFGGGLLANAGDAPSASAAGIMVIASARRVLRMVFMKVAPYAGPIRPVK